MRRFKAIGQIGLTNGGTICSTKFLVVEGRKGKKRNQRSLHCNCLWGEDDHCGILVADAAIIEE